MAWPRFVWGETSRERELRAIADALQGDCDRKGRRIAVGEEQLAQVIAGRDEMRRQRDAARTCLDDAERRLKASEAERDAVRAERDDLAERLKVAEAERDSHAQWRGLENAGRIAAQAERDAAIAERDDLADRLKVAERVRALGLVNENALAHRLAAADKQASDARTMLGAYALILHALGKKIEDGLDSDESQDDRPAQDCGADGAGREPE